MDTVEPQSSQYIVLQWCAGAPYIRVCVDTGSSAIAAAIGSTDYTFGGLHAGGTEPAMALPEGPTYFKLLPPLGRMDRDRFEDHMMEKAKELLEEAQNLHNTQEERPDPAENVTDVDDARDGLKRTRMEADHLARHREHMGNDELRAFLEKRSDFHETLEDETPDFSDWETRFLLTRFQDMEPAEMADELERDVDAVEAELDRLGLEQ